jgi:outer membrane protein assembly factor BamB
MLSKRILRSPFLAAASLVACGAVARSGDGDGASEPKLAPSAAAPRAGSDWPQWGRDATRNMSAPDAKGLPGSFDAGKFVGASDQIDFATTKNVLWIGKLGSQAYGNPTVAGGRVYVGTNNDVPRNPTRFKDDRCTIYCFDEKTGAFLWEFSAPKLGTGKVSDWEYLGMCSSPAVASGENGKDKVYVVTNRCEVVCLDANGLKDGNDGPYQDEAQYTAGPNQTPIPTAEGDADILWVFNMIDECGVFPHNITSSSPLVVGDRLWISTSNGVDYGHKDMPSPNAPCLILLDRHTGELLGEEAIGLGTRTFHGNWSSPTYLKTDKLEQGIFGGPDGFVYGFAATPEAHAEGFPALKELWRFDVNKPEYRVDAEGKPRRYATRNGPSECLGTPITWDGKVYASIGQDPEHGDGVGRLVCIDPSGSGDVTKTHQVWAYDKIRRAISTAAVLDGMLVMADYAGFVYCLDAKTGKEHWVHDTKAHIWGSPLLADGKVVIGNEDGILTILPLATTLDPAKVVEVDMHSPIYSSAITANGVLYVGTHTHLYAIGTK